MKTIFLVTLLFSCFCLQAQDNIPLAGTWSFSLDESDAGLKERWAERQLPGSIYLPGTTDEAKYGHKTSGSDFGILTREYKYYGPAWYQREIVVPESWKDKRIYLEMERVMWESRAFVDGKEKTTCDALNSSHWHDLGFLSPGKHLLTVRINNDLIHNIGDKGHAYTEYTQTIWNGAVGRIQLVAKEKIRLSCPQVFTKINPRSFLLMDTLINESGKKQTIEICYELIDRETGESILTQTETCRLTGSRQAVNLLSPGNLSVRLWDDIHPNLYTLKVSLSEKGIKKDVKEIEIGFREIRSSKSKLLVNDRPVFLRGNLDCVHFPLTGYPSCSVGEWERIFRIYKDYGLNHVRFHSWCPPQAAFIAADRIGIYIQAEAVWIDWWMTNTPPDRKDMITKGSPEGLGKNPSADAFIQQELKRMVQAYGNHASFAMMCIGNELGNSDFDIMESWIKPFKEYDFRRLYAVSTARKIMPLDQYMATHYIDKIGSTRGLKKPNSTDWDFENVYSQSDIPIIAHEIGQWPVYPRWDEIKKYTGVLKARNFEEFREQARKNKIEEQNEDFVRASGALNQIMYKYEIESFLRTPSCAGIQLLSLQDYQGQGEALIGWLDVFYDSKGITTPEKFRCHFDTTVPLLRMPKYVWENNESFNADIQLAHYGSMDLSDGLYWKISDSESNLIGEGRIDKRLYETGTSPVAGTIACSLASVKQADKLTIEIGLQHAAVKNTWNIWVYPAAPPADSGAVYIADRFDKTCEERLNKGGKVLLVASELGDEASSDKINFNPLYWSLTFFPGQGKNTIGLVVRDKHPVYAEFPTDNYSDWQWQSLYKGARAFYINDFPENYKPAAQPVDDFHRNNKLASIFELKAGKGKLLVCGFDLKDPANPAARQLKSSILHYMNSKGFDPSYERSSADLKKMFTYIEPLKSTLPGEFRDALLYVTADKKESKKGVTYDVVRDNTSVTNDNPVWEGEELNLTIRCPRGIIGSLYVRFLDEDKKGREGNIVFEGRNYELKKQDEAESWVKFHVMREDSNDGMIVLKANVKKGKNLMISGIALMEE